LVVPLVLPVSKAYDVYWTARHIYYRNLRNAAAGHDGRVAGVVAQLERWNLAGRPGRLHTSRKSWQSVAVRAIEYKQQKAGGIDVDLHDVLDLDVERGVVRVEPRVNMGQLTRRLAPKGWTVPVVAELDDLTVGGLILGYGIESSAHKYGLFANTVVAAEVVLADGRLVRASATENADLFHALPWSYGALGFLTAVELRVIPAKPYVRVTYEPVQGLAAICARFTQLCTASDPPEFLEMLFFDLDRAVIVHGDFADLPAGAAVNHIARFYKPWFYKHIESFLQRGNSPLARPGARFDSTEYLPLRDYYHRYTRSLYWHGELLVPFGNHPLFRYTLGWLMPPKVSLMRLTQTEGVRKYRDERNVVQDALMPIRLLREGVEMFHREFECYPLWVCGHRAFRTEPRGMVGPSRPELSEEMFVDIGAWQVPRFVKRKEAWNGREAVRRMEAWLRAHGAFQCLYAVTEQTRDEFWQMFDRTLYEAVREKYGAAGAFMDVFDKVKRPERV
ncbi:MAG: delta(24)-sterol reductase isoform, partial [Pseudomonadota bacterium]